MRNKFFILATALCLWGLPPRLLAQDNSNARRFSLAEAIEFALKNNVNVKNSQIDAASANARVGEIRAIGLPQISASGQYLHNIKIQSQFVPANAFNPAAPENQILPLAFGVDHSAIATLTASQLLFDGSYFIGLKAAKTYKELSQKTLTQSKTQVTEAVTKAYYSVLVNSDRLELLNINLGRLDTLLRETKAMYENGFVEKIDLDRLEVQLNNLNTEKQKVVRLAELSSYLLKFQMGVPLNEEITLTDGLPRNTTEDFILPANVAQDFNYNQRIEYSLLQNQKELANLDVRNSRAGYLPSLAAFASFGYNTGSLTFDLLNRKWYNFSNIGLSLNVPIFDGLQKYYKVQQSRLTLQKTAQSEELLKNSIDLEIRQSVVNLTNALETLKSQQRNMELAQEVERVTRIKYQQGVGSNIEVINAVSSYREAQTNYYTALYDAVIARIDYRKATGTLVQP
jgi:outer membrane protein TolC